MASPLAQVCTKIPEDACAPYEGHWYHPVCQGALDLAEAACPKVAEAAHWGCVQAVNAGELEVKSPSFCADADRVFSPVTHLLLHAVPGAADALDRGWSAACPEAQALLAPLVGTKDGEAVCGKLEAKLVGAIGEL